MILSSCSGGIVFVVKFSRWWNWHQLLKDIQSSFCHVLSYFGVFLFTATDLALVLLRLKLKETCMEVSTSCVGSAFIVVWFSFVYILMDSGSHGSCANGEDKSPKYLSKWRWKLETSSNVGYEALRWLDPVFFYWYLITLKPWYFKGLMSITKILHHMHYT